MDWFKEIPQEEIHELDAFRLFGFEPSLDLNEDELERRYIQLTQWAHPDRNHDRQDWAILVSARINQAYQDLGQFRTRAEIYLQIVKPGSETDERVLSPEFLMEIFQWNEMAEEGTLDFELVEDAIDDVHSKLVTITQKDGWTADEFRRTFNQLKYLENLLNLREET